MSYLRVLMLTARFWPTIGGAQTHVFELSHALVKLGLAVTIVAEKNPSMLPWIEKIGKVNVYRAPVRSCKFLLFPTYLLMSLLAQCKLRAYVLHAHFAVPCGLVGVLVSRIFRVPLIITVHGIDIIRAPGIGYGIRLNPVVDRLTRAVLREADHVIACSEFTRNMVLDCGVSSATVSVVPNGVGDLERKASLADSSKKESIRQQLGLPVDTFMLFAARRLEPKNGVEYLIRATKILLGESRRFHLVIAGDGPLRGGLEKLSLHLGLDNHITFVGEVDQNKLESLYLATDVVVLPSVVEAFGLPVVESMAFHRPVITFNSGGPAEIVEGEATGIIVKEMNDSALAKAVLDLSSNPSLIREFQARSSQSVQKYEWKLIAERTKLVYAKVLGLPA